MRLTKKIVFLLTIIWGFLCSCVHICDPPHPPPLCLPQIHLEMDHENLTTLANNVFSDRYVKGKIEFEGVTYDVDIRHQGHVSRDYYKKNYKIKFSPEHLFQGKLKIILSAQMRDPSFMRYSLSIALFQESGLLSTETKLVALFLNDEFKGIYLLIEPIDEYFFWNRGIPPGNLYKAVGGNARFTFRGGYDVRGGYEKKIIKDENYSDLEDLIGILDTVPTNRLATEIEKVLDVKNALNYLAVSVLINNWDGLFHNFYFFHNPNTNRFEFIPWDLDMTFGIGAAPEKLTVEGHSVKGRNYLFERLLQIPAYRNYYKERLLWLIEGPFSLEKLDPRIQALHESLREDYLKDPVLQGKGASLDHEIEKIRSYVSQRQEAVLEQLAEWD